MEVLFENKDICSKCKGVCCKKSGCDYSASDFEHLNTNFLYEKLKEGKISIVSYQDFKQIKGKITSTSFLYLRARNKNRDIVDLLSLKTTCLLLNLLIRKIINRHKRRIPIIINGTLKKLKSNRSFFCFLESFFSDFNAKSSS